MALHVEVRAPKVSLTDEAICNGPGSLTNRTHSTQSLFK